MVERRRTLAVFAALTAQAARSSALAAFLRISRSIRRSLFSRRSLCSSSRSAVVSTGLAKRHEWRGVPLSLIVLACLACGPSGDYFSGGGFPLPGGLPGTCTESPYGSVQWQIHGFYKPNQVVDPRAVPLIGRLSVGESVSLDLGGSFCGARPDAVWTSTNPSVASLTASDLHATLTGISEGETVVYATKHGSRGDLRYYCCGSCASTEPPARCQKIPIATVRVVR